MKNKLILKFILIYLSATSIFILFFLFESKKDINKFVKQKTNEHYLEYKAVYNEYRKLSSVVYSTGINTKKIIDIFKYAKDSNKEEQALLRKKLFDSLSDKYNGLISYELKQLHFHLPNNKSFLRMHRPNKFGDDLTNIRETVKFVNKEKAYIHGFEEGRIFNGFRFVYPLFDEENTHLGSVEISFSSNALLKTIKKDYGLYSNFIIKKDVVEDKVFKEEKKNYVKSPHKDFYFEKETYDLHKSELINIGTKDLTQKINKGKPFSYYVKSTQHIKTMIPIRNPISKKVVAAICVCEEDKYIISNQKNLYIIIIFTLFTIAIITYLFYKQRVSNNKLEDLNNQLDRKVKVEIQKNRHKDLQILNQAKMASIGEILNNIAHHWRQPLNAISTSASGLLLHKEVDTLDDKNFELLTNSIIEQTKYLSNTINNFKDFVDEDHSKQRFCIQDRLNKILEIINSNFKYNYVQIDTKFEDKPIFVTGMISEISQALLNILNNAKDVLVEKDDLNNRNIYIEVIKKNKHTVQISIEDNGGGIPYNIIDKIFNPYFTTKHESVGTGIGLYMCYEMITKNFKGNLHVKNAKHGAKFIIELPISE